MTSSTSRLIRIGILVVTALLLLLSLLKDNHKHLAQITSNWGVSFSSASTGKKWNGDLLQAKLRRINFDGVEEKEGKQFWHSIKPSFICPSGLLTRVGKSKDGGKWTCGLQNLEKIRYSSESSKEPCIVYSFGVNGDSSFEAEVLATTHCNVYAYDPTVSSIASPLRDSNPRVKFAKLGINGEDRRDNRKLSTFMKLNGHEKRTIAILKMDVEGYEYPSLKNIFKEFPDNLPFAQILVEFHVIKRDFKGIGKKGEEIINIFTELENRGFRLFNREVNELHKNTCSEFSFINVKMLELFFEEKDLDELVKTNKDSNEYVLR